MAIRVRLRPGFCFCLALLASGCTQLNRQNSAPLDAYSAVSPNPVVVTPLDVESEIVDRSPPTERRLRASGLFASYEDSRTPSDEDPPKDAPGIRQRREIRGQSPQGDNWANNGAPGNNNYYRQGMPASGAPRMAQAGISPAVPPAAIPPVGTPNYAPNGVAPPPPGYVGPSPFDSVDPVYEEGIAVPFDVILEEERTGRFIFGVGVNSDAGVTGQIVIDEQNFDWRRPPGSWNDVWDGVAWRGGGQRFRLEAMPGDQVQRYLVSFTEPYLFDTQVSMSTSGSYYDRGFIDWDEQRLGGRLALGYRLSPDLSVSGAFRGERVTIFNPRASIPELDEVVGDNSLFGFKVQLAHDTRDVPFSPTEGHLFEINFEQVTGSFDYPRAELDYRQHFLVFERPDGSGRHTLSYLFRVGVTGSQTPIFENYYAGGFSTLRGFDFRGASPVNSGVIVGGEFRFLGSVEYMAPLTADDMIKGVIFCDYGTVEEKVAIHSEDFRVSVGAGLRIAIPALGPAPLALDFAVPLAREDSDDIQNFSFFFGMGRF